jgi:hypothetical protein
MGLQWYFPLLGEDWTRYLMAGFVGSPGLYLTNLADREAPYAYVCFALQGTVLAPGLFIVDKVEMGGFPYGIDVTPDR